MKRARVEDKEAQLSLEVVKLLVEAGADVNVFCVRERRSKRI